MAYLSAHVIENGVEAYEYIEQLLSQPSLPSNLDEAMEEESQHAYGEPTAQGFAKRSFFKRGFKAGAQWRDAQILKLPNNIDETAEEYAPDFSNDFASKAAVEVVRNAFKAGAEWMAGQCITVTGDTDDDNV